VPGFHTLRGMMKFFSPDDAHNVLSDLLGLRYETFSRMSALPENKMRRLSGFVKWIHNKLEALNSASELSTRLGVFSGYDLTPEQLWKGLNDALETTFFWGQRGMKKSWVMGVSKFSAFAKARMVVADRIIRMFGKDKIAKTLVRLPLPILLGLLTYYKFKDDKDFQELPYWRTFTSIPVGKIGNHWVFIPVNDPYYSVAGGGMITLLKTLNGDPHIAAGDYLANSINSIAPFDTGAGSNTMMGVLSSALPDMISPLAQIAINKDFFTQRAIIPEWIKNYSAQDQYSKYTSPLAVGVAKGMASLGVKISPIKLQFLLDNYFSSVGKLTRGTADSLIVGLGINPNELSQEPAMEDLLSGSGLSSFIHQKYSPSTELSVYEFNQTFNKLKGIYKKGETLKKEDPEKYKEYIKKYWQGINAYYRPKDYYSSIRKLNMAYRKLEATGTSNNVRLELIKEQVRRNAEMANNYYHLNFEKRNETSR